MKNTIENIIATFRDREHIRRESLQITVAIEASFEFDHESGVSEYHQLIEDCRNRFGDRFRWSAEVGRGVASFGFVESRDAVEFMMIVDRPTMPSRISWAQHLWKAK